MEVLPIPSQEDSTSFTIKVMPRRMVLQPAMNTPVMMRHQGAYSFNE
ncbi:hypothetical protein E6C60_4178 [Paenibacillus algicola]|uniref:Uncharacterized protein n=1 Tax=Paenibacillus algicola TaxID=2565926 RepID=A0A4P8XQS9_9BACL|nr:hypothetical protein E6C60_4178 [Paenibacillus algicola]